jgi:methionyl-tRNA formyltransferase
VAVKVALLTCNQPWQRTLAARLAARHALALIVVDQHLAVGSRLRRLLAGTRGRPATLLKKLRDKTTLRPIERRDDAIYESCFSRLGAPPFTNAATRVLEASSINSESVAQAIGAAAPDVIVVSGTRLLRSPIVELQAALGMVNLHTGLSPYYRGGPCTFWALYNEQPEFAGATVHYLTKGIDSGDMILSARARIEEGDGVAALDSRVIDLGHQLVLRALELLERGDAPRVPQWEKGRLFQYRDFTVEARLDLERRLQDGLVPRCLRRLERRPPVIRTISA